MWLYCNCTVQCACVVIAQTPTVLKQQTPADNTGLHVRHGLAYFDSYAGTGLIE